MSLIDSRGSQSANSSLSSEKAFKAELTPFALSPGLLSGYLIVKNETLQQTHIFRYLIECVKKFFNIENQVDKHKIQYKTLELFVANKEFLSLPDCSPLVQSLAKRVGLTYAPKNAPAELKKLIRDISRELLLINQEERDGSSDLAEQKTADNLLDRFSQYYNLPVQIKKIDAVRDSNLNSQNYDVFNQKKGEPDSEIPEFSPENSQAKNSVTIELSKQKVESKDTAPSHPDFLSKEINPLTINAKKLTENTEKASSLKNWKTATISMVAFGALASLIWYMQSTTTPPNIISLIPYGPHPDPFVPYNPDTMSPLVQTENLVTHIYSNMTSSFSSAESSLIASDPEPMSASIAAPLITAGVSAGVTLLYNTARLTHSLYKKCIQATKGSVREQDPIREQDSIMDQILYKEATDVPIFQSSEVLGSRIPKGTELARSSPFQVYNHSEDPNLALKILPEEKYNHLEYVLGKTLDNPILAKTLDVYLEENLDSGEKKYILVMEKVKGKRFSSMRNKKDRISQNQAMSLIGQAKDCCQYLFREGVFWGGIKDTTTFIENDTESLKLVSFEKWGETTDSKARAVSLLLGAIDLISQIVANSTCVKTSIRGAYGQYESKGELRKQIIYPEVFFGEQVTRFRSQVLTFPDPSEYHTITWLKKFMDDIQEMEDEQIEQHLLSYFDIVLEKLSEAEPLA